MRLVSFFLLFLSQLVYADIIPEIKARGYLNCGVTTGLPGFSYMNDNGQWSGFEVDYCRGIAVAIFNDPQKVKFIALSNQMQFLALNMKQVDVLARVISINYTRSTQLSGLFPVTHYIDDEAILTYRLNINQLSELDNKTICVVSGSTAEQNLYRYATNHGWSYKPLVMSRGQLAVRALASGRCRAMVGDRSSLYVFKKELPKPELVNISDESIGLEPLGLMIRENDIDLYRLIQWTHYTLVAAEANEITKDILVNGQLSLQSFNEKLNISQLTFKQLQENWMYHLIANIGNYGEIFATNLTKPLGIPRNMNNLITNGGLMYAPSLN